MFCLSNSIKIKTRLVKKNIIFFLIILINLVTLSKEQKMPYNHLSNKEKDIILHKGTEKAFSGEFYDHKERGGYFCKQCNAPLFLSKDKFDSGSGWPSFDDTITGALLKVTDKDGARTEILCSACKGHLGHLFKGEGFTVKNVRYCVNSTSLSFSAEKIKEDTYNTAIFASGCFWGSQYWWKKVLGVKSTVVGYIGGTFNNPTYEDVCLKHTGHAEAVKVVYNTSKVSYEELVRVFFKIHDPTQKNRQGADIGSQYRSAIFYLNDSQKKIAIKIINILIEKKINVVTNLEKANRFWDAENYHQDYYKKSNKQPYCHSGVIENNLR